MFRGASFPAPVDSAPWTYLTNVVPAQYEEVGVFMEPLDVWQNLNGTNFLDLTYSDPAR